MEKSSGRIAKILRGISGNAAAVVFLCALPLCFHHAFFDINRCKTDMIRTAVPVLALFSLLAELAGRNDRNSLAESRMPRFFMLWFLTACVVSCAANGMTAEMLSGSSGRYCGLEYLLCCGAGFFILCCHLPDVRLAAVPVLLCMDAAGLLGVLNALRIDPLGFYAKIQESEIPRFLSTIGNVDFFGAAVMMCLPVSLGGIFAGKCRILNAVSAVSVPVLCLAAAASGSDIAFLGTMLSVLFWAALSGGHSGRKGAALCTAGWLFLSCSLLGVLTAAQEESTLSGGMMHLLSSSPLSAAAGLLLIMGGIFCLLRGKGAEPGERRKKDLRILAFCLLLALLIYIVAALLFTFVFPDAELGSLSEVLRFGDGWGSRRGFVFVRALRALGSYTSVQMLFGRGMETVEEVLTPYFDDPEMLTYGVFNDVHNQWMQFLLTAGLFGMAGFAAFQISMLRRLLADPSGDSLTDGFCALFASYIPVSLLTVTQPVVIGMYFAFAGMAAAGFRRNGDDAR